MFTLTAQDRHGVCLSIIDDQGRKSKKLSQKNIVPTLRAEVHGNVPKVIQLPHGYNKGGEKEIAPCLTGSAYQHNNLIKECSGIYTGVREDFQRLPLKNLSRTLKASKFDAGITDGVRIRRLTPRECWRLQGYPDEYFDRAKYGNMERAHEIASKYPGRVPPKPHRNFSFDERKDRMSDTQLYKQAGNGVTVTVARAIGERLADIEREEQNDCTK